jgi:transcriptional regulator with XRE-family HTH domain
LALIRARRDLFGVIDMTARPPMKGGRASNHIGQGSRTTRQRKGLSGVTSVPTPALAPEQSMLDAIQAAVHTGPRYKYGPLRMAKILRAIRQAIEASGKTRYQLSKKTGIDQSHLSRLMKGGTGLSLEAVEKLAAALDVEIVIRPKPMILDRPVDTLGLSVRAERCLKENARKPILTVRQLVGCSARSLLAIPNFGQTTLMEIRQKLTEYGLRLKGES